MTSSLEGRSSLRKRLPQVGLMAEFLRVLQSYLRRDPEKRLRALRQETIRNPGCLASWIEPLASWEEGEISAAHRSAQAVLRIAPADFCMLVICLDYQIRARDSAQIYSYAKRLIAARNPAATLRRVYMIQRVLLWPLWLLGFGRGLKAEADAYDKWAAWASNYVTTHAPPVVPSGT
jgi:hypothetical protein